MAGLSYRKAMVGTRRAISVLPGINGLRNKPSHLVGPPSLSPVYKPSFLATQVSIFDRKLVNWWVCLSYQHRIISGSSFAQQPKETRIRVCLRALEAEKMASGNAAHDKQ